MKRVLSLFLVFIVAATFVWVPGVDKTSSVAYGANKATTSAQISSIQDNIDDLEKQQKQVSKDLSTVASKITTLSKKVDNLTAKIATTSKEISATEKKLKLKQTEIEGREKNLYERLRIMYMNGSVGFMDVLLGSSSISEFVYNTSLVQRIYQNDVAVLSTLEDEHKELADIKAELSQKKADLASQQKELDAQKTELAKQKKILEQKEDQLKEEADKLTLELLKLIDVNSEYVGGTFTWPCPSSHYISSPFGNRLHPILKKYKMHTGVDIAAATGKNIVAAATGKVITSKYLTGYGYTIMIDHGGGIVTLYGHCSKLIAKQGDIVKRGDTIAKVGSTGDSTGPHLHFEVRVNGDYVDPMSYFN